MSVVLRLHHENHPVMLIPGDLDSVGLADLIERGKQLICDILLFPHHGGHIGHGGSPAARVRSNAAFAKPLIPCILPGVTSQPEMPDFLKDFTWVDFRDDASSPFGRLIWGITGKGMS